MTKHIFDVDIAKEYGMGAAVILENIRYWIAKNRANNRHFYDGRYWTYNSVKAFGELFPYMTTKQIRNALDELVEAGLLLKGNYNENAYDRTVWYALTDKGEGDSICPTGQFHLPHRAKAFAPQGEPIPDINIPDINPIINTDNPPSPMYSLRNDKETSYGTEEGNICKLLTGEYIGYPPQGEAPSAPSKSSKKNSSDIPFDEIRDLYNTICTSLPKCRTITDKRRAAIRARWKDGFGLADFEEAFKAAQASRFLKGQQGERAWRADFDFLVSPKMVKVLEGAYSGKVDFTELGFSDRGKWEGDVDNGDF